MAEPARAVIGTGDSSDVLARVPVLEIAGLDSVGYRRHALYIRVGTETKWEWRKPTDAEYEKMLLSLNA